MFKIFLTFKRRIFYKFFRNLSPFGYSNYVDTIEVNNKNVVIKDKRFSKMIEVPIKSLFKNIPNDRKKLIFEVFNVKLENFTNEKSILILTQPLYRDFLHKDKFPTEVEQLDYYRSIVEKYKKEYTVYFKVHPRDLIDYSLIDDIKFLDKNTPMEIYEFFGNFKFDLGITYSSTVLDNLDCVREKIFLKDRI